MDQLIVCALSLIDCALIILLHRSKKKISNADPVASPILVVESIFVIFALCLGVKLTMFLL